MFDTFSTFEPIGQRTVFFNTKRPINGATYTLHKSFTLFSQKSDIIELSPTAIKKQENEETLRLPIKSDNDTKISVNGRQAFHEEQKEIIGLRKNSRNVKFHELAYRAAIGIHIRGPVSFEYETGPDVIKYTVAGPTTKDTHPIINNPEAFISKAQVIKMAKIDPSVSVEVETMVREANIELKEEQRKESDNTTKESNTKKTIETALHTRLNLEL